MIDNYIQKLNEKFKLIKQEINNKIEGKMPKLENFSHFFYNKKRLTVVLLVAIIVLPIIITCTSKYNVDDFNFYDMEKHGARIVEIEDYNFEENYVLVRYDVDIWGITNDNIVIYSRDLESSGGNYYILGQEEVGFTGTYTIISEDIMSVYSYDEGDGTLSINSRNVHPTKNNVVVIHGKNNSNEALWINEEAIDWEREVEEVVLEEERSYGGLTFSAKTAYKLYLK